MKRPNVLIVYTDQQRWDTIRAAGNELVHTPNLDSLAERGVLFENAFCNNPVCMPSRHSMLSGQYPSALGSTCNGIEMCEDVETLPTLLKPYGYHTANIGKLHFKNHSNRDHREPHPTYGFDTLILSDEPGCYDDAYIKWVEQHDPAQVVKCRCEPPPAANMGNPHGCPPRGTQDPYVFQGEEHLSHTAFVAEESSHCIRRHRDEPFALIAGFYAPHAPINPPQRFVDMYDVDAMPDPAIGDEMPFHRILDVSLAQWRKAKAYYYALVSHIDDQIGRILSALDECDLRDNTLIVFTADHGEHLGDHGLGGKGAPGWDSCTHVPLLVSLPECIAAGRTHSELIEAVDILPTLLDYCGVQAPPAAQGHSFRPLIEGKDYTPRTSAFCEHRIPFGPSWKVVRTHTHKYCANQNGRELLYDLMADPKELFSVAADAAYADALDDMRHELTRRWFDVEMQYPLRTGRY